MQIVSTEPVYSLGITMGGLNAAYSYDASFAEAKLKVNLTMLVLLKQNS